MVQPIDYSRFLKAPDAMAPIEAFNTEQDRVAAQRAAALQGEADQLKLTQEKTMWDDRERFKHAYDDLVKFGNVAPENQEAYIANRIAVGEAEGRDMSETKEFQAADQEMRNKIIEGTRRIGIEYGYIKQPTDSYGNQQASISIAKAKAAAAKSAAEMKAEAVKTAAKIKADAVLTKDRKKAIVKYQNDNKENINSITLINDVGSSIGEGFNWANYNPETNTVKFQGKDVPVDAPGISTGFMGTLSNPWSLDSNIYKANTARFFNEEIARLSGAAVTESEMKRNIKAFSDTWNSSEEAKIRIMHGRWKESIGKSQQFENALGPDDIAQFRKHGGRTSADYLTAPEVSSPSAPDVVLPTMEDQQAKLSDLEEMKAALARKLGK